MKKTAAAIATASAVLLFLAILYLTFGIFLDRKNGPETAATRYETLLLSTQRTASAYRYGTAEFANSFIAAIGDISDFAKIDLELNGALIYSYPPGRRVAPPSEFAQRFSETRTLQNGSTMRLSASIYTMRPSSIYSHARISFIIILAGTLTAILLLMYTAMTEPRQPVDDALFRDEPPAEAHGTATEPERGEPPEEERPFAPAPEPPAQMELTSEELTAIKEIISTEKEYAEAEEEGDFTEPEGTDSLEDGFGEDELPESVPLPVGRTLENAIDESLKKPGDLSLMIIRAENVAESSPLHGQMAEALRNQLGKDGTVRPYQSDGFAAILENTPLNAATALAEPLQARLSAIARESGEASRVTVGISSKAEREIEADRLIREADQAEAHAQEDADSPIVAFRANPEKYKQMIMGKQAAARAAASART